MTSRSDGWDGWIKFDTGKTNPVAIDYVTDDFHGYAWGADVVGWISFNCLEGSSTGESICGTSDYRVEVEIEERVLPPKFELDVAIGTPDCGTGTVVSDDSFINCPGDCFEEYNQDKVVTLTAASAAGSEFDGWTGGASDCGTDAECAITMSDNINVTANFSKASCSVALSVSCSAAPSSVTIGETTKFTAKPKGGTTPYTYTWKWDDDSLDSKSAPSSINKSYLTDGVKEAFIEVEDSSAPQQTAKSACPVTVTPGETGGTIIISSPSETILATIVDGLPANSNKIILSIASDVYDGYEGDVSLSASGTLLGTAVFLPAAAQR